MNIKEAKDEIAHTLEAYFSKNEMGAYRIPRIHQRPILLMGPPGIGKTAIVEQVAREKKIAFVSYTMTHHTRQSAIGLPFIREKEYGGKSYSVTEYTMSEIIASVYDEMEESGCKEGILFIDEINCVSETLAPTMLQFLQEKAFGNHKIPEGFMIVAAGNPPEYNKSVREFDVVTRDRVREISIEEDIAVWKDYAYLKKIHGAILSYLEIKKSDFYVIETSVDGTYYVTARGWEDLSQIMRVYETLDLPITEALILEYINHPRVAKHFANYYVLYQKYGEEYHIEQILAGGMDEHTLLRAQEAAFDEKISVIGLLLERLGEDFKDSYEIDQLVTQRFEQLKQEHKSTKDKASEAEFEKKREKFLLETKQRESQIEDTKQKLSHAFYFVEKAFGNSQEMVVFLSELTRNFFSMQFISENGSEDYYKYSDMLLFQEERQRLLQEIKETD
ncbi:MAG: AAA family ATPase [Velocimicrobium sp.]